MDPQTSGGLLLAVPGEAVAEYLSRVPGAVVIGDVILDRYVTGSVHRLSPEAPIPVLRPANNRCTLGGAANVAAWNV